MSFVVGTNVLMMSLSNENSTYMVGNPAASEVSAANAFGGIGSGAWWQVWSAGQSITYNNQQYDGIYLVCLSATPGPRVLAGDNAADTVSLTGSTGDAGTLWYALPYAGGFCLVCGDPNDASNGWLSNLGGPLVLSNWSQINQPPDTNNSWWLPMTGSSTIPYNS